MRGMIYVLNKRWLIKNAQCMFAFKAISDFACKSQLCNSFCKLSTPGAYPGIRTYACAYTRSEKVNL